MVSTVAPTSYALAKLQLDKSTPLSVQTFVIKFTSAIGPTHAAVLRKALADNNLNPTGTRDIAQHTAIYDLLINCLPDAMDVLAVTNECACLGPKSVDWLLRNYAPTTTASPSTNGSRVAVSAFTVLSRHEPGSGWTRTLPEKAFDIGKHVRQFARWRPRWLKVRVLIWSQPYKAAQKVPTMPVRPG